MDNIKLSEKEKACLLAMASILNNCEDGHCIYYRSIAKEANLPENQVRKAVRSLARKGLAEFHRGLLDEEGFVAGSGHCLSRVGEEFIKQYESHT